MENKKRPRGLKKSLAQDKEQQKKRIKQDIPDGAAPNPEQDSQLRTVAITSEDPDEISILKSLYDAAVAKQESADLEGAVDLFRGCIHECDKILRIRCGEVLHTIDEKGEDGSLEKKETGPLPPAFYLVYGNALAQLGLLSLKEDETATEALNDHLEAALERLERGLERAREDGISPPLRLRISLGKVCLLLASNMLQSGSAREGEEKVTRLADRAAEEFKVNFNSITDSDKDEDILEAGAASQRYADLLQELQGRQGWNDIATALFQKLLEVNPSSVDASIGIGACQLSMANYYLEKMDDGDEVDGELIIGPLKEALSQFESAQQQSKDADTVHVPLACLMGETLVNLGNLYDDTDADKAEDYWKNAIKCFRKVQEVDPEALPEQFKDFVDEWEKDLDESQE
ncbi:uncharacterized protein SPPG_06870 [Spizellomyces punctatus DAOM BR117]|uniref:Enhancer of translation termination 1 n=1 Tax=Spizellomyces punctatus (strain DAOM BR117) TaxID=645134 RepID=A0A0L0HAY3_SPIPD|nr:uncharacterized protein SPPG_06870 [Spizellomyces punctatus DAOM BR117]KNC97878.1 hypothetical protein SPPG_06870 [Spizellomyces punctatus DAOM BR117]|eukprot:XP_016605918.1 hypothetical protein SPPG_06870 [Spizellomyces punctatus DAOM BR117]